MTKEKLIEAALTIYAEQGYKGTTMKKVADAIGIKAASIYFFYPNKEALLGEVFQKILENHQNELHRISEQTKDLPVRSSLQQLIRRVAYFHLKDVVNTKAYIKLITSDSAEYKSKFSEYLDEFETWLMQNYFTVLKEEFPNATHAEIQQCIHQIEIIANGLFWSTIIYPDDAFEKQVQAAEKLLLAIINQLKKGENETS